ncbi:MAG: VWA domain-containing protein [bacterium]|nr:VWA domain-containing protein [bacterium]
MIFGNPINLYLLLLIPGLIIFYIIMFKQKRKLYEKFGNWRLLERLTSGVNFRIKRIKAILIILAFLFLILSLANPKIGRKLVEIKRKGMDVIIAVDCSLSMKAQDIKPDRLSKAKEELITLINRLQGNRIGIIAFSGTAHLMCPLTLDYGAAKMFLELIDTNLIPRPGTAIGRAIRLAIENFPKKEKRFKILILLTDGEDTEGDPIKVAKKAKQEGISIYPIGIGKTEGEPIPLKDKRGQLIGYKKDKEGEMVISKLNEETLQKIAVTTGGKYYQATSGRIEVEKIREEISSLEKKELKTRLSRQYEDRFQYFLICALGLLIIEFILPERKRDEG